MNESSLYSCVDDEILMELFELSQSDPEYFNTVMKEEAKDMVCEILEMMEDAQEENIIEIVEEGLDDESFERNEEQEEENTKRRKYLTNLVILRMEF
jgi:hypothetical protein